MEIYWEIQQCDNLIWLRLIFEIGKLMIDGGVCHPKKTNFVMLVMLSLTLPEPQNADITYDMKT